MKRIVLVCGPAGIGKSTFCTKMASLDKSEHSFIISADEVRKELCGSYSAFPKNHNMMVVYREMVRRAKKLAKEFDDLTLYIDTTMLYDERRLFFVRNLGEYNHKTLVLLKLHDYSLCLIRNKQRVKEKWVPEDIIVDMSSHYDDPSEDALKFFDEYKEIYLD